MRTFKLLSVASLLLLTTFLTSAAENSAEIPADYKLAYEQKFDSATALQDFRFTDPAARTRTCG